MFCLGNGTERVRFAERRLVVALAAGLSYKKAAARAHVCIQTVARRMRSPSFRKKVSRLQERMTHRAVGNLASSLTHAAVTLRELLSAESESVRLGAARSICEMFSRMKENIELSARVEKLETLMGQRLEALEGIARKNGKG
jgi:hypothetical protein